MLLSLELLRVLLSFAMLFIAAIIDVRKKAVSDWLWIVFIIIAAIVYVFDFPAHDEQLSVMISIATAGILSFIIYKLGFFGGADALALFTLSLIMPTYDQRFRLIEGTLFLPFVPYIVLTNALVTSMIQIIINVTRNLFSCLRHEDLFKGFEHEPVRNKVIAFAIGYKSKSSKFTFPLEKSLGGRKTFDFKLKNIEFAEYESRDGVWVTPAIPFLVYLLAGFVIMLVAGNILEVLLSSLLRL